MARAIAVVLGAAITLIIGSESAVGIEQATATNPMIMTEGLNILCEAINRFLYQAVEEIHLPMLILTDSEDAGIPLPSNLV